MNSPFKILVFSCIAFAWGCLYAQPDSASFLPSAKLGYSDSGHQTSITSRKAWITVGWGYQNLQHQDLIFSPLIHRDGSIANGQVAVGWGQKRKHLHEIGLRTSLFNPGPLAPYTFLIQGEDNTAWNHSFTFVSLHYHFQFKRQDFLKIEIRPGLKLDNAIWAKSYGYGRSGAFGYFAALGLKGTLQAEKHYSSWLNPHAQLELPLLAWVARSPYLANDDEFIENISSNKGVNTFFSYLGDGSLQTWNRLQSVNVTLGNTIQFWRHRVGIHYHVLLLHHSRPIDLVHLQQGISINFTFHL
jgi:hypothetical protein